MKPLNISSISTEKLASNKSITFPILVYQKMPTSENPMFILVNKITKTKDRCIVYGNVPDFHSGKVTEGQEFHLFENRLWNVITMNSKLVGDFYTHMKGTQGFFTSLKSMFNLLGPKKFIPYLKSVLFLIN